VPRIDTERSQRSQRDWTDVWPSLLPRDPRNRGNPIGTFVIFAAFCANSALSKKRRKTCTEDLKGLKGLDECLAQSFASRPLKRCGIRIGTFVIFAAFCANSPKSAIRQSKSAALFLECRASRDERKT
jgi:hypothetical protein